MESHLRYGNLIWSHLPEKKLCALQKIQNRAFYLIESAPIQDRIPSARLIVEKFITYDRSTMVHRILKEMCSENLKGKFARRTNISKYETRRINDLLIPRPRLEIAGKSFSYVGAKVWNDIPHDIGNVESNHPFKRIMRTYRVPVK